MVPNPHQHRALEVTERVSSFFSLLGTTFIIITFLTSRSFRKPINRIVFYASFANIATNVPTLISRAGIRATTNSALCQTQGFLITWFMIADPLFTLAMALNVYLTFFRRYSAEQLRSMEWKYLIMCYGLPFPPALTYFFVRNSSGVRVYGPATLWCWMSPKWDFLRIIGFYGPIWVVIVVTMSIYTYTGFVIWKQRRQLKQFSHTVSHPGQSMMSIRTTEVKVTREVMTSRISTSDASIPNQDKDIEGGTKRGYKPYTVTINACVEPGPTPGLARPCRTGPSRRDADDVAWGYTRAALAYFAAMVITWVPSSIYRVYGMVYPDRNPYVLVLATAIVLPLQGFWNSLIYIIVSQAACREYVCEIRESIFVERLLQSKLVRIFSSSSSSSSKSSSSSTITTPTPRSNFS